MLGLLFRLTFGLIDWSARVEPPQGWLPRTPMTGPPEPPPADPNPPTPTKRRLVWSEYIPTAQPWTPPGRREEGTEA